MLSGTQPRIVPLLSSQVWMYDFRNLYLKCQNFNSKIIRDFVIQYVCSGEDPTKAKMRLKQWAQVVACSVRDPALNNVIHMDPEMSY